jgi:DNA-binding NarL/FixJ family response regulator
MASAEYTRMWRIKNKEAWDKYWREYQANKNDHLKEYNKKYYRTQKRQKYLKKWLQKNRKKYNEYQRIIQSTLEHKKYRKEYDANHRDRINENQRNYRKNLEGKPLSKQEKQIFKYLKSGWAINQIMLEMNKPYDSIKASIYVIRKKNPPGLLPN